MSATNVVQVDFSLERLLRRSVRLGPERVAIVRERERLIAEEREARDYLHQAAHDLIIARKFDMLEDAAVDALAAASAEARRARVELGRHVLIHGSELESAP